MKVRIYYDGVCNVYVPQYKWMGIIWCEFTTHNSGYISNYPYKLTFVNQNDAVSFLNYTKRKTIRQVKNELSKDSGSGVVYEET